jgi:adenylate cyclase
MPRLVSRNRSALIAGLATILLIDAALLLLPESWPEIVRENAYDAVLAGAQRSSGAAPRETRARVIVVDIDRRSLEEAGAWPWPRERMAELANAIAAAGPAAITFDILFVKPDDHSPAALARQLAAFTGRTDVAALAQSLPDGDALLSEAFKASPVVLGFVLDPEQTGSVPTPPVLIRGRLPFTSLWRGAGAIGPPLSLAGNIQGLGALSLPAGADGVIRHVPLFVGAGESLLPGLALETARVLRGVTNYALQSDPPLLIMGETRLSLPSDGLLRLLAMGQDRHAARTVAAVDVLRGASDTSRLAGAAVVVGGSAPELGGLRKTPADPLTPDAQIQADAVDQILAGRVPRELAHTAIVSLLALNILLLLMLVAATELAPFAGTLILGVVLSLLWGVAMSLATFADRLFDPLTPSLAATAVFAVASTWSYAMTHRREALVRRRFEQHLAPAVVRRIVDEPDLVKLNGERRQVTALFTDIESFTSMTHRAGPEQLVAMLDQYFEGCAAIIIDHGGMIDKIVGDAIHALFNAPVDLPDHPKRAVASAMALRQWSAAFRQTGLPASLGFGRTRIGIETGDAIVGDVGIRAKLDYTAHGDAVNAAARLEAANKELGSTICVGPMAASCCDAAALRPLGTITLRGRDEPHAVFEPWPEDAPKIWRAHYLAAFDLIPRDPAQAAERFAQLAKELPSDLVPSHLAAQLRQYPQEPKATRAV